MDWSMIGALATVVIAVLSLETRLSARLRKLRERPLKHKV